MGRNAQLKTDPTLVKLAPFSIVFNFVEYRPETPWRNSKSAVKNGQAYINISKNIAEKCRNEFIQVRGDSEESSWTHFIPADYLLLVIFDARCLITNEASCINGEMLSTASEDEQDVCERDG